MRLQDELIACGCTLGDVEFRGLLADLFADLHPNWTDEDLLCRPDDAKRYANLVRHRVGCPALADYPILRTLTNLRKHK